MKRTASRKVVSRQSKENLIILLVHLIYKLYNRSFASIKTGHFMQC